MTQLDPRNCNSLWCSTWVETWVREGLRAAVICPGSRSTPLAMALARHEFVDTTPVVDERSAAFFALGRARALRQPVALLCTSGSAGAHFLPAIIEAHETGAPVIVITADRPPELRECAAGQTIDQQRLFGAFATWYHEMAVPELSHELFVYLRQTVRQAWHRAERDGPVHLNAPFRDPLPPVADDGRAAKFAAGLGETFWERPSAPLSTGPTLTLAHEQTTQRGLIVAGPAMPSDPADYAAKVFRYAQDTGWPILADGLSPLRHRTAPAGVTVVSAYDTILRNDGMAQSLAPRYVLGLESWPTSKVLRQWLERSQAEMSMVSPHPGSRDALHGRTREISAPATSLRFDGRSVGDKRYAEAWGRAEERVNQLRVTSFENDANASFEGQVAWRLAATLGEPHALVLASSMPVRDWEYFAPSRERGLDVYCSRGANGIDGTISTAAGVAASSGKTTVLLTGDLAFLHDSNGLMLHHELSGSLTVIVINNRGGGIFEHLPISGYQPEFERYFATPPSVDLGTLCAAHGVPHAVSTPNGFTIPDHAEAGIRVIEIRTDRRADAALRKRLFRDWARQLTD